MARVFLSYRRDDTAAYAGRLYDRLVAHFGANQVFIDIDQIEPGIQVSGHSTAEKIHHDLTGRGGFDIPRSHRGRRVYDD